MRTGIEHTRHSKAATNRGVWSLALAIVVLAMLLARPAVSVAAESKWYAPFWPLGQKVPVTKLSDKYIPFEGKAAVPPRPELLIEAGDAFLDSGKLFKGFEVPILGAVWQPRLWSYFIYRTTLQSFDNGTPGRERETEWANRLDFFANLQLTGTEKILLGLRPVDENRPGAESGLT